MKKRGTDRKVTSNYDQKRRKVGGYSMRKPGIIAVDFDGTLCEKAQYPNFGKLNRFLFDKLKAMQKDGWKLILWTCRTGKDLEKAVEFCSKNGLVFDAVNQDIKTWEGEERTGGRKISADIYIDDKAVNPLPFNTIPYQLLPAIYREHSSSFRGPVGCRVTN